MRFRGRISHIKLDKQTYLRDFDRAMNKFIKEAARVWLTTVLNHIQNAPFSVGDSFPIRTGEAKGSLLPVGRALGITIPISPAPTSITGRGRVIRKIRAGERKGRVLGPGKTPVRMIYRFHFNTSVLHFLINEIIIPSGTIRSSIRPWESLKAGKEAFKDFVDTNLQSRIPRIEKYLLKTDVTYG